MPVFSRSVALICIALALLTACGSQESANTNISDAAAAKAANDIISSSASDQTDSGLLQSLAALYPNGQLPANRTAQASQDLSQNPAALKLTAETANAAKGQSTANAANAPIAAQAVAADYLPVQRVQNTTLYGAYFFSIYPTEITTALATNPNWALEGPAFWASLATGTDLYPVHRFRNKTNGSYLYSIYETERADIAANYAATFEYEGVAWYARQTPATGWSALYRFRNKTNGTYLFSAYESEKDAIVATYPDVFALEGIAYYVRQDAQPDPVVPPLSMTSAAALGTFTLGNTFTKTVEFDATLAAATITGLPSGVTASAPVLSGKTATFTLTINPLVFAFTSAAQPIGFTVNATGASSPAKDFSVTASVNDVAPNFAAQADATRGDNYGSGPIIPVTGICPTGTDQFGRAVTCAALVTNVTGGGVGILIYDASTNSVGGTFDCSITTIFQIRRIIRAVSGGASQITDSVLTLNDEG